MPAHGYRRGVNRLRCCRLNARLLLTTVLALCLGVRLLTPAGFMPSFAGGSLAIVPCPDAEGAPPVPRMTAMADMAGMDMHAMAMPGPGPVHDHGHGNEAFHHPSCPYAAAASLAGLGLGIVVLAAPAALAAMAPPARALPEFRRPATRDRPPAQGPPLPA